MTTTLATQPDTGTATAAQLWARLGTAIEAANLPAPSTISVNGDQVRVYLHDTDGHTYTDLCTWMAWLRASRLATHVTESPKPGYVQRDTSVKATWRGWDITVVFIETFPVERVEVAVRW